MVEGKTNKSKMKEEKAEEKLSPEREIARLAAAAVEAGEEIKSVSQGGSSLEDIEGAKAIAAEVLHKYSVLLNQLSLDDAKKLQQTLGIVIEQIKKGLMELKEAPE